jgi:CRP-like cAMP-binding protein
MGDPGDSMMLVETGEVRIGYPAPDGRAVVMSELKPGALFGEIALLDGGPRSADATAATNCTLLVFEQHLLRHTRDTPPIGKLSTQGNQRASWWVAMFPYKKEPSCRRPVRMRGILPA